MLVSEDSTAFYVQTIVITKVTVTHDSRQAIFEFFTISTKLSIMATLASQVFTRKKKFTIVTAASQTARNQFLVQMPKAKVSWQVRQVSKTYNVMHFAGFVKQPSVDLVSGLFVYYRLDYEPFVCSWDLHYYL